MITYSQKLIDITTDENIIDVLQTTGHELKDLLTNLKMMYVKVVVYTIPVVITRLIDNDTISLQSGNLILDINAIRLIAGNLIIDINELETTIASNLPTAPLEDYNVLNLAALLIVIKHMKLSKEKESL